MARVKAFRVDQIKDARKKSGMNQFEYWERFGITQSGGSRYETGRNIPLPTRMLLWLVDSGRVSAEDLADAIKAVKVKAKAKA